ncbi:V2 [Turnip curly top virus]|uniref:V2 n=1 Tax=Turnip curly top virus TaxID=859650 RepID=L0CSQ5_9GEMI|nr:V2 [Turnip curly top virus]AYC81465.1 V2 [Binary vector pLX-TCTV]ADJ58420.1 V2 [Turnip curly top virus]ADJ58432.1 V2 [Turnip curly top virus]ADJ58438.1 V2 [Turnip curly top virus]AGA19497.1 V2 [Turnip curly top virus]
MIWRIAKDDKRVRAFRYKKRRFYSLSEYLLAPLATHLRLARILPEKCWSVVPAYTDEAYSFLFMLKEETRTPFQILKDEWNVEFKEAEVALSRLRLSTEDTGEETGGEESPVQQSSPVQSSSCET